MDDQSKRQIADLIDYHESRQEEGQLKVQIERVRLKPPVSLALAIKANSGGIQSMPRHALSCRLNTN